MKQKEYIKLITDITSINTKLLLEKEKLFELTTNIDGHLASISDQLSNINLVLSNIKDKDQHELKISCANNKHNLHNIEKELQTHVETPLKKHEKQLLTFNGTYQKLQEQLKSIENDCEFDLIPAQELIKKTKELLMIIEDTEKKIFQQLLKYKDNISKHTKKISELMLDRELKDITQQTASLSKKIIDLEHCLGENPNLIQKHEGNFSPLKQALEGLNNQTKLLELTSQSPIKEETTKITNNLTMIA